MRSEWGRGRGVRRSRESASPASTCSVASATWFSCRLGRRLSALFGSVGCPRAQHETPYCAPRAPADPRRRFRSRMGCKSRVGWRSVDTFGLLSLDRVSELILANLEPRYSTTLLRLWQEFGVTVHRELIEPRLGREVATCIVEVVSEVDFTYRDSRSSESLNLETLSDSKMQRASTGAADRRDQDT